MKPLLLFSLLFLLSQPLAAQSYERKVIDIGNIGLSITNVGTVGRPDVRNDPQGNPSMEYPLNSGVEHLFEGGIWIGAYKDGQIAVSTAAVDASGGYRAGDAGFEFTPKSLIRQRSTLTNSDNFSFDAVSHQDMVIDITDENVIVPGTTEQIDEHTTPLNAGVHVEAYAWNYSFADYFVILDFTITNNSSSTWDSVYFGMWADMVVRNVNVATETGAGFFNKGAGGYIDSLNAIYVFDVKGEPQYTRSYGAMQFLGVEWRDMFFSPCNTAEFTSQGLPAPKVNASSWKWRDNTDPDFPAPTNDAERYERMKNGLNWDNPTIVSKLKSPDNRTQLISAGPLTKVEPGETVKFAIAMVAAPQLETGGTTGETMDTEYARTELKKHLGWSQRTYFGEDQNCNARLDAGEDLNENEGLDRYILPEPPVTPKVKIVAESEKITIYWDDKAEASVDPISKEKDFEGYRIYRSQIGEDKNLDLLRDANLIAQWDMPENNIGYNNGFEKIRLSTPVYFEGDTTAYHYKYELSNMLNGWQYLIIITAFDRGNEALNIEPLESSYTANAYSVWPGTPANENFEEQKVGVYPNPYKTTAPWDGSNEKTRKIYFYNLPEQAEITVYTLTGDVVAKIDHTGSAYKGSDSGWYNTYGGAEANRIHAGGEHAWDMLSASGQALTQGLYLFSVKDLSSGNVQQGQFVILK